MIDGLRELVFGRPQPESSTVSVLRQTISGLEAALAQAWTMQHIQSAMIEQQKQIMALVTKERDELRVENAELRDMLAKVSPVAALSH